MVGVEAGVLLEVDPVVDVLPESLLDVCSEDLLDDRSDACPVDGSDEGDPLRESVR